jgi:hypothetical protein
MRVFRYLSWRGRPSRSQVFTLLSVPAIALLISSVVHVVHLFRSRAMKPTLGETVVALFAGLVAAVLAGLMGGIAAIFTCTRLLTGEEGEGANYPRPCYGSGFCCSGFCVHTPLGGTVTLLLKLRNDAERIEAVSSSLRTVRASYVLSVRTSHKPTTHSKAARNRGYSFLTGANQFTMDFMTISSC